MFILLSRYPPPQKLPFNWRRPARCVDGFPPNTCPGLENSLCLWILKEEWKGLYRACDRPARIFNERRLAFEVHFIFLSFLLFLIFSLERLNQRERFVGEIGKVRRRKKETKMKKAQPFVKAESFNSSTRIGTFTVEAEKLLPLFETMRR